MVAGRKAVRIEQEGSHTFLGVGAAPHRGPQGGGHSRSQGAAAAGSSQGEGAAVVEEGHRTERTAGRLCV